MNARMTIKEYIKDNFYQYLDKWLLVNILSNKSYLKWKFKRLVGYPLDLNNPRTYNEKLQWLKLYDYHPEYSMMVDKIEAKQYVASILGQDFIIPTLGIWDNITDVNWNSLPNQFVIKVSSDSGGIVVCKDKKSLNIKEAIKQLSNNWGKNYYKFNKEYPYRSVKPRIIAEEFKEDESGELKDYKFFCFNGIPKFLFVASDRQNPTEETKFDFFDMNWNHLPVVNGHPNSLKVINKPTNFAEMIQVASKLSKGIPHVRVDLYNINGKIYFGELTFFHWSGMVPFEPVEWDYKFGELLSLPKQNKHNERI